MLKHRSGHRNSAAVRGLIGSLLPLILFMAGSAAVADSRTPPGDMSIHHRHLANADGCVQCHGKDNQILATNCLKCHGEIARRIEAKRGYHADKDEGCELCHVEHQGRNHKIVEWNIADFDHEDTGYSLTGRHQRVKECRFCHNTRTTLPGIKRDSYLLRDNRCTTCHTPPHAAGYDQCGECHQTTGWWIDPWGWE